MSNGKKSPTKSEIYASIAEKTGISRKQVKAVFTELGGLVAKNLKKGPKVFSIPGICKIVVKHKPASPERQGINPFTKQMQTFKAKPARNVVKLRPVKALKDMV